MRGHIVFSRELFKAEWTGIHFDIAFVGGYIVATEIAYMCVNTGADFAAVRMFTLFGTIITHRTFAFTFNYGITRRIQFGFWWR